MPFTRVSMLKGKSSEYKHAVIDSIYDAMRLTFDVPENDIFMVIHEHEEDSFNYGKNHGKNCLNIKRTDDLLFIQVTASNTRTVDKKTAFFSKTAELLVERIGIRIEDVFINIVEVPKENWSFGNGLAQYA